MYFSQFLFESFLSFVYFCVDVECNLVIVFAYDVAILSIILDPEANAKWSES